jgi:hypothetical protein
MKFAICAASLFTLVAISAASGQSVIKQEPGPGLLGCGATVLVDDGTCGKGKIKQVTGGCNVGASSTATTGAGAGRKKKCVSR